MNIDAKKVIPIIFICLLLGLFFLNRPKPSTPESQQSDSDYLAQISSSVGDIKFKKNQQDSFKNKPDYPDSIFSGGRVQTFEGSQAQLSFDNNWVLDLNESSHVEVQIWGEGDDKKILAHFYSGSYSVISEGNDTLLILYKNHFYKPGDPFRETKSLAMKIYAQNIKLPAQDAQNIEPLELPKEDNLSKNEVSIRYIEASIFKKRNLFEKCLANRLRENKKVNGRILVGFNVTKLGSLANINIIDNKTQDKKIESCVTDVFSQIKIRNYNGPKTFFAFPVDFK